jgi:predicted XRE-type DNA-binding protein
MNEAEDIQMECSTGNVFADLGFEDAANMKIRAQLSLRVRGYVERNQLSQTEAASRLGVTQPRLNDVIRGRVNKVTIDRLVNMLDAVGERVELQPRLGLTPDKNWGSTPLARQ